MRIYRATVEAVKASCTPNHSELVCRWDHSDRAFTMEVPLRAVLPVRDILIQAEGWNEGEPLNPRYLGAAPLAAVA